jgi:hypothetical protein
VVDPDERLGVDPGEGLGRADPDEERPGQARPVRHGDGIDLAGWLAGAGDASSRRAASSGGGSRGDSGTMPPVGAWSGVRLATTEAVTPAASTNATAVSSQLTRWRGRGGRIGRRPGSSSPSGPMDRATAARQSSHGAAQTPRRRRVFVGGHDQGILAIVRGARRTPTGGQVERRPHRVRDASSVATLAASRRRVHEREQEPAADAPATVLGQDREGVTWLRRPSSRCRRRRSPPPRGRPGSGPAGWSRRSMEGRPPGHREASARRRGTAGMSSTAWPRCRFPGGGRAT